MPLSTPSAIAPAPLAITLIARPGDTPSRDAALAVLATQLPDATPTLLGPEAGVLIAPARPLENLTPLRQNLTAALAGHPVDIVIEPAEQRAKALFLADMDSTMIGQECIDELAAELGLKDKIAAITERAMRGEIAFEPALRERVALLAGLNADVVDKVIANRITLNPGGRTLVRTMRAQGAYCALVSGGFTAFTEIIAERIGFDENRANRLMMDNGILTGAVAEPILGREAKRARLETLRQERQVRREAIIAIGDGANDLDMLEGAGLGVAYRAKPAVAAAADARLDHADLTALLYAQGFTQDDFVTDERA